MMRADFVIVGLPASGKTTFLAALWHLVEAGEEECRLKLGSYEGDLTYLNKIAEAWRSFQPVPRTSQVGDANVTLELVDQNTNARATAFFPDLAGETFDAQVEARRCRPELIDSIAEDDGVLLFVSADVKGDGLSIIELNAMMPPDISALGKEGLPVAAATEAAETNDAQERAVAPAGQVTEPSDPVAKRVEWEPKMLPSQVRVVQILSDMLRAPFEPRRRRLAVIISAWDLTKGMNLTPNDWLASQMPLVDQFLKTNTPSFDYAIYGVSAQGVSLSDEVAVGNAAKLTPSRRIHIEGPDGEGHDLTSPLVWLMSAR